MRSSFLLYNQRCPFGGLSSGERGSPRSSHPPKSRISDEASLAGGEPPDTTATPDKPSLTGGAGSHIYLSSGQASGQPGISSLKKIFSHPPHLMYNEKEYFIGRGQDKYDNFKI
ncbi:hypothetical protein C8U37_102127 [Trichococcus patagoniensis]|uniref:Uncharacterized protein n=1 Tax=Trichococcus patagoniensis TaxID=382641 RepID=A0A2T5IQC5_9LACT|nr:hypothetical protein C8U37_102127 [Trichococcus patagoniensis]